MKIKKNKTCWICDSFVHAKLVRTRDGNKYPLNICCKCNFYFFPKDFTWLITSDRFEQNRLKKAGLEIPNIKEDFRNGAIQTKRYIKEWITKADYSKNILEIGCSWGYFLKPIKDLGINCVGVEINPIRANYVEKKLKIPCCQTLEEVEQRKTMFHKIFIFFTLQYISHPKEYINRLLDLLKRGGTIYIVTPNHEDVLKDIWRNQGFIDFFYEKMSVGYYTVKSLHRLMVHINDNFRFYNIRTKQGYSFLNHLSWYFTDRPRTTGIVGGDNYCEVISEQIKNSGHMLGKKIAKLIYDFCKQYYRLIEQYNYGNQIILKIIK